MQDGSLEENCKKYRPVTNYKVINSKYKYTSEDFRFYAFAKKITKNPWVKDYKFAMQEGLCPICNRVLKIDAAVIHHIDYDNTCMHIFNEASLIEYPHPTEKRENRTVRVPDCSECMEEEPERFKECMDRIVLVHRTCHMKIHGLDRSNQSESDF